MQKLNIDSTIFGLGWLEQFIFYGRVGVSFSIHYPYSLWEPRSISDPVFHEHSKHIEVYCHFVCEKVAIVITGTSFMKSKGQLAFVYEGFFMWSNSSISSKLSMIDIYALVWHIHLFHCLVFSFFLSFHVTMFY